jgi:lipid-A-disaccharide synthase
MAAPRIFISVAEQSADEHAAAMISAFRREHPDAAFAGLAGPAMQAAGCECFKDMTAHSAMALAALGRVPESILLMRRLKKYFASRPFDAAVLVDSPALHLPIAKLCRNAGIPVLYYIAPQTWAWGWTSWRNARIHERVTRLACIWPFEVPHFAKDGISATYVGHPSFDRLLATHVDENRVRELRGDANPVITILPGSREHVVNEVFPGQMAVCLALQMRYARSKLRFLVVAANGRVKQLIESHQKRALRSVPMTILAGDADRAAAIRAADLVLVASGTITLEVAYHATPMIVMYNTNRLLYNLVGRWLINTPHLSIPNILAGRRIVPEFMPYFRSPDAITARAVELFSNPIKLQKMREDLRATIQPIVRPGAAANTARELSAMLDATPRPQ